MLPDKYVPLFNLCILIRLFGRESLWCFAPFCHWGEVFQCTHTASRYTHTRHASRHTLAPVQFKGFVPLVAAFMKHTQHYLLSGKTRVEGFTLSLSELVNNGRFPQRRPRLHLTTLMKHISVRKKIKASFRLSFSRIHTQQNRWSN